MAVAAVACGEASNGDLFAGGHTDRGVHPAGSGGTPAKVCGSDTDCANDRVCENGTCVAPSSGGAAGSQQVPPGAGGAASPGGGGRADGGTVAGGRDSSGGRAMGAGGAAATAGVANGGSASGGVANGGTSGANASGGVATGGLGAGGKPTMCGVGQKACEAKCVYPTPAVGCDAASCTACPTSLPPHAYVTCANSQCSFECLAGYVKVNGGCLMYGGSGGFFGGSGGFTGIGGYGGGRPAEACNTPSDCHNACTVANPTPCCSSSGKCGCSYSSVPGGCF
jgi:HlyD family secretion protein